MISVCIATFNGEPFIASQIRSILDQLGENDEIVVSDNNSSDQTIEIVRAIGDPRIKVITHHPRGIVLNFENCLKHSSGEIIFLCDQDDVWLKGKITSAIELLNSYDLVLSNGKITDECLAPTGKTIFNTNPPNHSLIRNIWRNSFTGCCMAFNRSVLKLSTPFPNGVAMHDWWIGLVALTFSRVYIDNTPRILYRRHMGNHSSTSQKSDRPIKTVIQDRLFISYQLAKLLINQKFANKKDQHKMHSEGNQ